MTFIVAVVVVCCIILGMKIQIEKPAKTTTLGYWYQRLVKLISMCVISFLFFFSSHKSIPHEICVHFLFRSLVTDFLPFHSRSCDGNDNGNANDSKTRFLSSNARALQRERKRNGKWYWQRQFWCNWPRVCLHSSLGMLRKNAKHTYLKLVYAVVSFSLGMCVCVCVFFFSCVYRLLLQLFHRFAKANNFRFRYNEENAIGKSGMYATSIMLNLDTIEIPSFLRLVFLHFVSKTHKHIPDEFGAVFSNFGYMSICSL